MLYLLYKMGRFLSLTLPTGMVYKIADILGSFYYLLARRDRKIAADNIRVVLNQTGNRQKVGYTSRMVFVNFARYLVEFFCTSKIDLNYIGKHVKIEGKDNIDKALSLGKGALLVSAHLGNWELGAIVLSMLGYKMNIVAWTHKNKQVNDFFLKQRSDKGVTVIPLGTAIRKVFSALKNQQLVAVLGDIDYTNPQLGVRVKFFGRDTVMPKGPAAFSLKVGCPIVPVFVLREKNNAFSYIVEEPIIHQSSGEEERDLTKLTERIGKIIETYISLYPAQWFMLTPRWQ